MAVLLCIVILAAVLVITAEAVQKYQDRKGWISGVDFVREVGKDPWAHYMTARMMGDPNREEFEVRFNPTDGHFYDRDNFGYHETEILLKRHEESGEV
jgi:hypothetical protein